jgi:uncharacterized protein
VDLVGPSGRLEALLDEAAPARFAALVCHPHPQMGGTMHNHATYRLARAVRRAGGTALRFNYRGVGRSAGSYDRGRGEADDARAVLARLRELAPALPVLCCGFSFGAWISVEVGAGDPGVAGLVLAGLPLRARELDSLRTPERLRALRQPAALIQAERDQFGAPGEVGELLAGSTGPRRLAEVAGAMHLFTEDLAGLERAAGEAVEWVLGAAGAPIPATR